MPDGNFVYLLSSVEIKFCKAVSSVLFIYVVIQKLIHYLNVLCVIPLLPINAVSVKLCARSVKVLNLYIIHGIMVLNIAFTHRMGLEGFVCN